MKVYNKETFMAQSLIIYQVRQENFLSLLCYALSYPRTEEVSISNTLLADIHKIADEIGKINQVDLVKIRLKLLEQWLPSSLRNKQDDADTVIVFRPKLSISYAQTYTNVTCGIHIFHT